MSETKLPDGRPMIASWKPRGDDWVRHYEPVGFRLDDTLDPFEPVGLPLHPLTGEPA